MVDDRQTAVRSRRTAVALVVFHYGCIAAKSGQALASPDLKNHVKCKERQLSLNVIQDIVFHNMVLPKEEIYLAALFWLLFIEVALCQKSG